MYDVFMENDRELFCYISMMFLKPAWNVNLYKPPIANIKNKTECVMGDNKSYSMSGNAYFILKFLQSDSSQQIQYRCDQHCIEILFIWNEHYSGK